VHPKLHVNKCWTDLSRQDVMWLCAKKFTYVVSVWCNCLPCSAPLRVMGFESSFVQVLAL
jgi:hypothetical protein